MASAGEEHLGLHWATCRVAGIWAKREVSMETRCQASSDVSMRLKRRKGQSRD